MNTFEFDVVGFVRLLLMFNSFVLWCVGHRIIVMIIMIMIIVIAS